MRRVLVLIAACLATALAAACSHDSPQPNYSTVATTPSSPTPTPTGSPSPTVPTTGPNVSPGELAPTEPPDARSNTSDGAFSFIAYYYKTSDWMFATSDPSILEPFYAASCKTCRDAQEYYVQLLAGSRHFSGGRITIKSLRLVSNDHRQSADYAFTGVTDVTAAQIVAADGTVVQSFAATTGFQLTDWIRFIGGRWQIVEERKV